MFIRSERLFLRPGWPEDWEELLERIGNRCVVRNLARAPWPYTAEDARSFVRQEQDARCPHFFITLPTSAEPARIVGGVGLARIEGAVELGYWIARDHWGKGFAAEAGRAVVRLARVLGHRELVAGHFVDNPASGRVLRKIGFVPTGKTRLRHCRSRGEQVISVEHRLCLGEPSDCGNEMPAMRAA